MIRFTLFESHQSFFDALGFKDHGMIGPVELTVADMGATVRLRTMTSATRGAGHASAALKRITTLADQHHVTLELTASPYGDERTRLDHDQLQAFYTRHGFIMEPGTDPSYGYMIRAPRG